MAEPLRTSASETSLPLTSPTVTRNVQIRDVPAEVVDELQARAAAAGLSLTSYLRNHLVAMVSKPTMAQLFARSQDRDWGVDRETIVRRVRAARDETE
ncbi:hypothetical protein GCM10010174_04830 [Kutzneria viridogrisea]|uniref:Plasmid stability protein n=1 Tax=Kutzneria viridogrisea TaxID=47990 RepID=A0ABR6BE44_9PSEU|nr:plasmid stability protein [Kutzneria viridogrisea]